MTSPLRLATTIPASSLELGRALTKTDLFTSYLLLFMIPDHQTGVQFGQHRSRARHASPCFYAVLASLVIGGHNFLRGFYRLVGANSDIGWAIRIVILEDDYDITYKLLRHSIDQSNSS